MFRMQQMRSDTDAINLEVEKYAKSLKNRTIGHKGRSRAEGNALQQLYFL